MSASPVLLVLLLSVVSSGRGCIPTVTPDYIYDLEWQQEQERLSTTSVLLTTVRESTPPTTSPSSAAPTTTTATTTSSSTSTSTSTSTTTTTPIPTNCPTSPEDWTLDMNTGFCYYGSALGANWQMAESMCMTYGGSVDAHLASIGSEAEKEFILNNVIVGPGSSYWIGLMEPMGMQTLMGTATWTDGTPYDYANGWTNWETGPPPVNGQAQCIYLLGVNSQWRYAPCTSSPLYICEVRATP